MNPAKFLLSTMLLCGLSVPVLSQGCSDAGVCSMHSIKDNNTFSKNENEKPNILKAGFGYAKGERSININTWQLEYIRQWKNDFSLSTRLTFLTTQGELAKTAGAGDVYITASKKIAIGKKWQPSFLAGLKLPLSNPDKISNGIQLPMPYQTSLGTADLLLGAGFSLQQFGFALALQQPLASMNKNRFIALDYATVPSAEKYWSTNKFSRKGDLVFRTSYTIAAGKKINLRPGLVGIYHLGNDSYINNEGDKVIITGSKGLTLNTTAFILYQLNKRNGIELSFGAPAIVREQRPDGLTRKFAMMVEYSFRF